MGSCPTQTEIDAARLAEERAHRLRVRLREIVRAKREGAPTPAEIVLRTAAIRKNPAYQAPLVRTAKPAEIKICPTCKARLVSLPCVACAARQRLTRRSGG